MELIFELEDLGAVAQKILKAAPYKTLAFYGDMGAGKTTLIKALLQALGAADTGSSPTFGIVNEYHNKQGELLAYHFDFYRLEDESEALDMGLEDYLAQGAWVFMEWPEKIPSLLPEERTEIRLELLGPGSRKACF